MSDVEFTVREVLINGEMVRLPYPVNVSAIAPQDVELINKLVTQPKTFEEALNASDAAGPEFGYLIQANDLLTAVGEDPATVTAFTVEANPFRVEVTKRDQVATELGAQA